MISNGGAGGGEERASRARAGAALVWRGGRDVVARCERWRRCAGWRRGAGWRVASGVGRGRGGGGVGRARRQGRRDWPRLAGVRPRRAALRAGISHLRAQLRRAARLRVPACNRTSAILVYRTVNSSHPLYTSLAYGCVEPGTASRLEGAQNFFIIAISSRRFAIGMRKASAEAARAHLCCG